MPILKFFIPEEFISKVTIDYPFDSDLLVRDNSVEEYSDVKYVLINKSETQVLSFNLNQNDGTLHGNGINGSIPGLKGSFTISNPYEEKSGCSGARLPGMLWEHDNFVSSNLTIPTKFYYHER